MKRVRKDGKLSRRWLRRVGQEFARESNLNEMYSYLKEDFPLHTVEDRLLAAASYGKERKKLR